MQGTEGARSPHETYCLLHGPGTVRSGKWKFYPWKEGKGGRRDDLKGRTPSPHPVQLYDTVADIGETKNLASEYPEVAQRLQAAYDAHVAELKANQRPTAQMVRRQDAPTANRPGNPQAKGKKKQSKKKRKKQ